MMENESNVGFSPCGSCRNKKICKYILSVSEVNKKLAELEDVIKGTDLPFQVQLRCDHYSREQGVYRQFKEEGFVRPKSQQSKAYYLNRSEVDHAEDD